jgi:hypothetical protein
MMRSILLPLLIATSAAQAAEPFAVATASTGATVTLHKDAGPCVNGALLAVWSSPDARETVPGCWVIRGASVSVSWLDGDRDDIPVTELRRVTGG